MTSSVYNNSALYLFARLSIVAASFLLLPLYTRLITPAQYGTIYILITTGEFLTALFSITIQSSITRFYFDCKTGEEVKTLYSSIIKFTIAFSGTLYLIVMLLRRPLLSYIQVSFYPCVLLVLLGSYFTIFYHLIYALLRAKQKAFKLSVTTMASSFISLLLTVVLVITLKDKIYAYILAYFLGTLMRLFIFILYSSAEVSLSAKDRTLGEYVRYSCARLPVDLSSRIVAYADRMMLYSMRGEADAGLYSLGYKMGQAADVLFTSVNKAYVPFAFDLFSRNSSTEELERKSCTLCALYFFVTFLLIVFARELTSLLDESYRASLSVVYIILIAHLINGLKLLFQVAMDYRVEYVRIKSILWIVSAVINIGLNIVWIPRYSYAGAAWATVVSYVAVFVPIVYFSQKAQKVNYPWSRIGGMVLLSCVYAVLSVMTISALGVLIKLSVTAIYMYALAWIARIDLIGAMSKAIRSRYGPNTAVQ